MFPGEFRHPSLFSNYCAVKPYLRFCNIIFTVIYILHIFQGAHDAEILTLSFTLSTLDISKENAKSNYFLASGGRDCMIHLYDVKRCACANFKDNLVGWLCISMTFWLYVAEILISLIALMIIQLQWLLSKLAATVAGSSVVVLIGMLVEIWHTEKGL